VENNVFDAGGKKVHKIMLVDDSALIRRFYKMAVSGNDDIIASLEAEDGQKAIELARVSQPDVIILDIEMPVMDGLTALPKILEVSPKSKVIISSTLTNRNAEISLKAMSLGAADYIEKPRAETDKLQFQSDLIEKIRALAVADSYKIETENLPRHNESSDNDMLPDAIAIGCSTGGPQALDSLFRVLKNKITDQPIFITQHMPPTFTKFLADNISRASGASCCEAEDGMEVGRGKIYLAPGDYHMTVKRENEKPVIRLNQNDPENFCRPSVDPMLRSVVDVYGRRVLAVIMTGMGQDGMEGVRQVVEKGGRVIIQDKESSVVWGMPGAVAKEGLHEAMYPLDRLGYKILEICKVD